MSVYRYLKDSIGASAFTRQIEEIPNRLNFETKHQDWVPEDWRNVLWSDESPSELYATSNRHNDRVWAKTTKDAHALSQ